MSSSPSSEQQVQRVAALSLRGRTGPVPARVYWPALPEGAVPRALLVFLPASDRASGGLDTADLLCRGLCGGAGVVVLSTSYRTDRGADDDLALEDAVTATQWCADHAAELDAVTAHLLVGGEGFGASLAAAVAARARDEGWPPILEVRLGDIRAGTAGAIERIARALEAAGDD